MKDFVLYHMVAIQGILLSLLLLQNAPSRDYLQVRSGFQDQQKGDTLRLLVRLRNPPINAESGPHKNRVRRIAREHKAFEVKFAKLLASGPRTHTFGLILESYTLNYNGYAILASRSVANELRKWKMVTSVSESKKTGF